MLTLFDPACVPDSEQKTPWGPVGYTQYGEIIVINPESNDAFEAAPYAAKKLGAQRVLFICRDTAVQMPLLPDQFIEFTTGRTTTYFSKVGTGYVQQHPPFCPELTTAVTAAGSAAGGTLLIADPITDAGRSWWAKQGITLISRHSQPTGALCRELELCFATLHLPPETAAHALLDAIQTHLPPSPNCTCSQSMALARKFGKLAADWEEWFV